MKYLFAFLTLLTFSVNAQYISVGSYSEIKSEINTYTGFIEPRVFYYTGRGLQFVPKTFYVSQSGSDNNNGTQAAPLKTLDKAWEKIVAGDTVKITGKVMFDRMQNLFGRNGTAAAPIVIYGENATLTRNSAFNQTHSNELIYFTGNYVKWVNIEIADFSQRQGEHAYPGFRAVNSNNCTWERINYHHNAAAFSLKGNSSNNLFLNCDFSYNQDPYSSEPYDGADGLDLHDLTGTNNIVRGCRAFWNSDDGFDCWDNKGYVLIENSWAFYNGYQPGNFKTAGNGTGIKLGVAPASSAKLRDVRNCLAYKNRSYGIIENDGPCGMLVTNCTAFGNGEIGFWFSWSDNIATLTNNIAYGSPQLHRMSASDIMQNNSWQNGRTADVNDFVSLDDKQLLAARQADGSLPGLTFLKVADNSDLKGLGASFPGTPGGPIEPPKDPDPPTATLEFTIHVYTDKSINKSKKPTASKELWFDVEVYSDGSIRKK